MSRKLGNDQMGCLRGLCRNGYWSDSYSCGWTWWNPSGTTRIMNSLVRRGLAESAVGEHGIVAYTPTAEGRRVCGMWPSEQWVWRAWKKIPYNEVEDAQMGFNTMVVIFNDALSEIRKDAEFGSKLSDAIAQSFAYKGSVPVHAGSRTAAVVVASEHADVGTIGVVGGNTGHKLFATLLRGDWREYSVQERILREFADHLGFTLRRKRLDAAAQRALQAVSTGKVSSVPRSLRDELERHGYITCDGDGEYALTDLGRQALL